MAYKLRPKLEILEIHSMQHTSDFIMELFHNKSFLLYTSDGQLSKPRRVKNGMAQGPVLNPSLYNIYTADFPVTSSIKYVYANNVALMASTNPTFEKSETILTQNMAIVQIFLRS